MRYRQHPLAPPLSRFVECVWFLRSDGGGAGAGPERIVPDGCPELVLQLASPCRASRDGEPPALQPMALLAGPLTSSLLVEPAGPVDTLGIRFRPGGLAPFLPIPVDELVDRQVPLEDLFGRDAALLAECVRAAPDDARRLAAAARFLSARLPEPDAPRRPVEVAIGRMLRRRGPVSIERLSCDLGISRRHLERSFRRETGMTAMQLGRVIRFQSVFRELSRGGTDWVGVALGCGYYDQPHLIRDFRELAGQAPGAFLREDGAFGKVFLSPERLERFFS
ncbi:MAG: DUF6597 domain-containing transcriptional factor [Thermoanaerobaculia bacterium]